MNWSFYLKSIWMIGGRYFFIAGVGFFLAYILFRKDWSFKKIQRRFPENKDYLREMGYSFLTIVIFATVTFPLLAIPSISKYTTRYNDIAQFGWVYYLLAYPIMFVMHDTYFYFAHRLMHNKKLFPLFHLVHHKSTNPSPWAAYAFHPLEALVEVGIVVIFLFTIPIHKTHLMIFFLMMIVYNVYGHLGYELYPKGFHKTRIGRWINTSVNHNQHHQYFTGNYGLYFLFWDRMLGTIRSDYDGRFEEATQRSK
jgi:sterol desaturase/sphingolipid hydroxylase (fatty acid hydroxylase superfamily)